MFRFPCQNLACHFFFQAEDGIRDRNVTGVQTCALPIYGQPHNTAHATPARLTHTRFRLLRVRSPLLTESLLFSLPVGTEMFHFPTFPPHTLYIQMRVTTHNMPRGFPIRTPSDHRSFTNSPRLIAGYHVLHRLLMPRHPPCALEHSHHHHAQHVKQRESDNTRNTTTKITQNTTTTPTRCRHDAQMLASTMKKP